MTEVIIYKIIQKCKCCENETEIQDKTYYHVNKKLAEDDRCKCRLCHEIQPLEQFNIVSGTNYRRKQCKKCYNQMARDKRLKKIEETKEKLNRLQQLETN